MDIVHRRVAGIDVHKRVIWVALRTPGDGPGEREVAVRTAVAPAREVGAQVQVAVQDLRDDEPGHGEQGHDEHLPEAAERQRQAEREPDHDAKSGTCHVISHSQINEGPYLTRGGRRRQPIRRTSGASSLTSNGVPAATTTRGGAAPGGSWSRAARPVMNAAGSPPRSG